MISDLADSISIFRSALVARSSCSASAMAEAKPSACSVVRWAFSFSAWANFNVSKAMVVMALAPSLQIAQVRPSRTSSSRRASIRVLLHPGDIAVHPVLHELSVGGADLAMRVEQALLRLDEGLGLAERRRVEIGEDVAQMLLRHRRADRPDRDAD